MGKKAGQSPIELKAGKSLAANDTPEVQEMRNGPVDGVGTGISGANIIGAGLQPPSPAFLSKMFLGAQPNKIDRLESRVDKIADIMRQHYGVEI